MAKDASEHGPPAEEDRDRVDFTWLTDLLRRVRRRHEFASVTAAPPVSQPTLEGMPGPRPEVPLPRVSPSPGVRVARRYALPVLMVLGIALISMNNHFDGVDWGDDFALYVHQAKALTVGNVGEVLEQNRLTVDNSGWHSFSPYAYPWGWPLVMAAFYAVLGLDYNVFKFLEVVAFCVFLLAFFAILRRRTGPVPATVLTLLIGLSPRFVGATDTVLSDLPFLCFIGLTLWWMDRCRLRGVLTASRRDLVVLGLLVAFTFNIRREGVALVVPLVALHAVVLGKLCLRAKSVRVLRETPWRKVLLPYGTLAAGVVSFQILLPTVLWPSNPGTGLENIHPHLTYYKQALAEQIGLKDPGLSMQLFHSTPAAEKAIAVLMIFAVFGLLARLISRLEEDVTLAAYLLAIGFIMLISPYQDGRYLYTITPFLLYFAYQAIPAIVTLATRNRVLLRVGSLAPAAVLVGLVVLNGQDIAHSTDYHRKNQYTVNGPETTDAQEMFSAVRDNTRGEDVILFFRARAMTLYTDRPAIQGSNLDQLLKRSDWYVMAKGSTYSQTLLTDAQASARGLKKTWENSRWVMWRVPARS